MCSGKKMVKNNLLWKIASSSSTSKICKNLWMTLLSVQLPAKGLQHLKYV